ncbi:MAG: alpha/beta fold hydrolase [Clostridia bacterium]|nr:alpha/beta fold hydrolase [Clostridia bacterium]
MPFFDDRGIRVYYEDHGDPNAAPLLLLHGNTASSALFAPVLPLFAERYRVIALDFPGNGKSDRIPRWQSDLWFGWAACAAELLRHLGTPRANVIGCSGGALAALNLALEVPELVNAVVADSFEGLVADPALTDRIAAGRAFAKQNEGFCAFLQQLHGEDWESVLDADTDAVVRHAREVGAFCHKDIRALTVPLLLTGSAEDEMFPAGHYAQLFGEISGAAPLAEAHIFPHGGHPAMLSNAAEFLALSGAFFAR